MTNRPDLAYAMAEAARQLNTPRDTQSALDEIVRVAAAELEDVDHVGVSIAHADGTIETMATTDELVTQLDSLQYQLGEGPCVHSITAAEVTVAEHIKHDQRWPAYVPRALELGLKAQLGLRLYVDEETLGGLNMYSTTSETIGEETRHMAEIFATHAALALGRVRNEEHLNVGLQTRKVIGQALGIVMERYGMDEDRAFAYLRRVSSHSNIKLRDVAAELVTHANEAGQQAAPDASFLTSGASAT